MDRESLYDIIYALAARDGREDVLFGNYAPDAREAFARALTGSAFPEVWFELPLAGEAWFDLHVLVSHDDVVGTQARFTGHDGCYADTLRWFADREEGVRQLALSYDVSSGDIDSPAVQLLADRKGSDVVRGFLEAAGQPQAVDAFRAFCTRMPDSWYACYTGVFPRRSSEAAVSFLRMECLVGDELQKAYARDASFLGSHLRDVGMHVSEELLEQCRILAESPFPLEFQFDVDANGLAGPTLGASLRFWPDDWSNAESRREMIGLMTHAVDWGVADNRWQLLGNALFAKRIKQNDDVAIAYCFPAFVKLRWRDGAPLDAKTYLLARVDPA